MVMPRLGPLPDPETLLIVGFIGGLATIGTFIAFDIARKLGPQLETPEPFAMFTMAVNRVLAGEAPPA